MKLLYSILSLAVVAGAVSAQCTKPCFAQNDDAIFADNSSSSAGFLNAIQFQVTQAVPALRLEIFTGEFNGTATLSLWSHDATSNQPRAQLTSGSFSVSSVNGWQGANLSVPQVLQPNTTYWFGLLYNGSGSAQISARGRNMNGVVQPYRWTKDNGQTWSTLYSSWEWKLRVYCCTRVSAAFSTYGSRCGPRGVAPGLTGSGLPQLGSSYTVNVASTASGAPVLLAIGVSDKLFGGLTLPFDLTPLGAPGCSLLCSLDLFAASSIGGSGQANFTVPIPNNNALIGLQYFHQALLVSSVSNQLGFAFSNGASVTLGQ